MNSKTWMAILVPILCLAIGILQIEVIAAEAVDAASPLRSSAWQPVPQNGVISKAGRYFLMGDMNTDRTNGIKIEADNVTLDLAGHAVRYTGTPKEGNFGVAAPDRTGITVTNGIIGGFWFNIHCAQTKRLRIHDIHFDDIPYIGINVAQSRDVMINDNVFDNFRYDLPKEKDSTYLVGINIGAEGAVIANNRFIAEVKPGTGKDLGLETVFVLFSAEVTKDCLVTKNSLTANEALHRSYGVWIATHAQATIVDNDIRNMKHGVCLAGDASALVCLNRFDVAAGAGIAMETVGISASGAKELFDIKNTFEGVSVPVIKPNRAENDKVTGG